MKFQRYPILSLASEPFLWLFYPNLLSLYFIRRSTLAKFSEINSESIH